MSSSLPLFLLSTLPLTLVPPTLLRLLCPIVFRFADLLEAGDEGCFFGVSLPLGGSRMPFGGLWLESRLNQALRLRSGLDGSGPVLLASEAVADMFSGID